MEYYVLGVKPGASREDVKAAYRKEAMRWHPDRHAASGPQAAKEAAEKFRKVSEAYEAIQSGKVYTADRQQGRGGNYNSGTGDYNPFTRTSGSSADTKGWVKQENARAQRNLGILWFGIAFGCMVVYLFPETKPKRTRQRPGDAEFFVGRPGRARAPINDPQDTGLIKGKKNIESFENSSNNFPPRGASSFLPRSVAASEEPDGHVAEAAISDRAVFNYTYEPATKSSRQADRQTGSSLHGPANMHSPSSKSPTMPRDNSLAEDSPSENSDSDQDGHPLDAMWRRHQKKQLKGKGIHRRTRPFIKSNVQSDKAHVHAARSPIDDKFHSSGSHINRIPTLNAAWTHKAQYDQ